MFVECLLASALAAPAPEVAEARRQHAWARRLGAVGVGVVPATANDLPSETELRAALDPDERLWLVEEELVLGPDGEAPEAPGAAGLRWSVITGSLAALEVLPAEASVSVSASATTWLWRRTLPAPQGAALALGEPRAADAANPPRYPQAPDWLTALRSRRTVLPRARGEALYVGEHRAPPGSVAVVAEHATEERLRAKLLAGRRYVHLAAFAVVDGPRSGVLLAPVADGDGWLSARELSELPFAGAVLSLSAPVAAVGELTDWSLQGLAEAALAGEASAVVTPSSPRPDDEALAFARALADQSAAGVPLDAAVAHARSRTSPHWLLLGDGRRPVYPGGLDRGAAGFVPVAGLALAGGLGLAWLRPSWRLFAVLAGASVLAWVLGLALPGVDAPLRVLAP